jgi:hypothetical protein
MRFRLPNRLSPRDRLHKESRATSVVFNDDLIRTAVVSDRVMLATANYNGMVIAIHAPIRDYKRCVTASLGRDHCGAELIEL